MTTKIYLDNPYIKQIKATVLNSSYDNDKYVLELDKTIFYPHMCGGQPKDLGTINGIKVIDVIKEDEKIIHILDKNLYKKEVFLSIDWETRFIHMQQHTGQHILSACFGKLFNAKTVGFHLGSTYTYLDIEKHNISDDEMHQIETLANEIIYSNLPIKTYFVENDDIEQLELRKPPTVDKNIRIVEIEGVDLIACAGTHVNRTGEVGIIKIRKWENYKGNSRIEFVCGKRALLDYTEKNNQINTISNLLSVKDNECVNGVEKLIYQLGSSSKEIGNLKEKLSSFTEMLLLNNYVLKNNIKLSQEIFTDEEIDFNSLRKIASSIISTNEDFCVVYAIVSKEKAQLIIGASPNLGINAREVFEDVIKTINGKGGGNSTLAQGGGNNPANIQACVNLAVKLLTHLHL